MEITKYTMELSWSEMYDLACALEGYIENNLTITGSKTSDDILNDFESELELLQDFVGNFGYTLNISEKTKEGHIRFKSNQKKYDDAEEWFKALLKQRRKEYVEFNKK